MSGTAVTMEQIAGHVGHASAAVFREQFTAARHLAARLPADLPQDGISAAPGTYRPPASGGMPNASQN
jgi:hypothetical protein